MLAIGSLADLGPEFLYPTIDRSRINSNSTLSQQIPYVAIGQRMTAIARYS